MISRTFRNPSRILPLMLLVLLLALSVFVASAQDMSYSQSPFLDGMELEPVEDRLPVTPAVVEPLTEEERAYGGNMRMGFVGTNPGWGGLWFVAGWENLMIWEPDFSGVRPNIAESVEVSEDVREYTFNLREGMRWSDGAPFTADDIVFYIEDILFNEELSPAGPIADWLPANQRDGFELEKVDDYTVTFKFPEPYGTFLFAIPTWGGRHITWFPKHYLSQFHADYNENVDELVASEEGVEDWVALFNKKASGPTDDTQGYFNEPDRPTLFPWIVAQTLGTGTTVLMDRNPYYWKVDPQGRQLPYIDQLTGISYQDGETRFLAMLNGDIDYLKDPSPANRAAYVEANRAGEPIELSLMISDGANTQTIHFNRTIDDPFLSELFANKDFRIAMSYAINREEIIEIVHSGQGVPAQQSPLEGSPLYNEQLATQYLEYDVDLANEILDGILPDKDGDGYRLDPDGNRVQIVFSVPNDLSYGTNWVQTAELLIGYWEDLGIEILLNAMPDEQFIDDKDQNNIEMTVYTSEGGAGPTPILDPRYYVPMEYFGMFGNGWYYWRIDDANAVQVEPPQWAMDARAAYENVLAQPTQELQFAAMAEVLQTAADEFYTIGISRPPTAIQPASARLGGIPDEWIVGWIEGVQKLKFPEQWFIIQ